MSAARYLAPSPRVAPEMAERLGEYYLPDLPALWKEGPLALDCPEVTIEPSVTAPWRTVTLLAGQSLDVCRPDEHTLLLRSSRGTCRLRTRDGLALCYSGQPSSAVWLLATMEAMRVRGGIALHACSYIPPDDRSVIAIIGRSGAGKSTHLMRQFAGGARVVSEDSLWLHAESGECTSVDRHVRLFADNVHAPVGIATPQGEGVGRFGASLQSSVSARVKTLWQIPWQRGTPENLPRIGQIYVMENFQPRPLVELPRVMQVRHLWEATGAPLLPAGMRVYEAWVARVVQEGR